MPVLRRQQQEESAKALRRLTALVDNTLLEKPRTFSGALAHWKSRRSTFVAYAGALSPDMERLMERAVAPDTDGEILNSQLSSHEHATPLCHCHVLRVWCPFGTL